MHPELPQPLVMAGAALAAAAEADDVPARGDRAGRADRRILDDRGARYVDTDRLRRMKEEVGGRLAARDMLAAGKDPIAKGVTNAEMVEVAFDPFGRARRGDGTRLRRRQRSHESDRAGLRV